MRRPSRPSLPSSTLTFAAATWLAVACAPERSRFDTEAEVRATGPGLVVLLVIDQWPQWAFAEKRRQLRGGGFDRLLAEGRWQVGRYPTAATLTAPGHATLGTGVLPHRHGIIANEWWRRDLGRALASVRGPRGEVTAAELEAPTLADALARAGRGGKAVAVSLKDRGAVLPVGAHGLSVWYRPATVDWASSAPAPWLQALAHRAPIAWHLHDVWTPRDPGLLRKMSGRRDAETGELGDKGLGTTFPHELDRTPVPAEALLLTPLGNQLTLDVALAAIEGEELGKDDAPDLLVISLSAHDYAAHAWGHESWELWDLTLRLDEQLARLLDALDAKLGRERWAMLVTSDHGASPLPELGDGGRTRYELVTKIANEAASRVLGAGRWIAFAKAPTLYLTEEALASPQRDLAIDEIARALRTLPGVARAAPSRELMGDCEARVGEDRAICVSLHPQKSGEVVFLPTRGWLFEEEHEPVSASHGSSHDYDQTVPIVTLPFDRKMGPTLLSAEPDEISITEVAETLARWLDVSSPATLR